MACFLIGGSNYQSLKVAFNCVPNLQIISGITEVSARVTQIKIQNEKGPLIRCDEAQFISASP